MSAPDAGAAAESSPLRILLVEDNNAASRGLEKLLDARGFAVTAACDGTSALAELRREPPPDFLLTDLSLPDLDGREVADLARRLAPRPRIALITGWDIGPGDPELAAHGIDWVFKKPLNFQELLGWLETANEPRVKTQGL